MPRADAKASVPARTPGGRLLVLGEGGHGCQPIVLSEFGGIAFSGSVGGTWGYSRVDDAEAWPSNTPGLLDVVRSLPLLAGFCYTEFADTYQGPTASSTPTGTGGPRDLPPEPEWRERIIEVQRHQYQVPPEDCRLHEDR